MNPVRKKISNVPTNIITGFLGVGKTSAILHLLKSKPANERWAVLVNEFGEIGIDGSFFQGKHTQENGVFIREIPGGCMCCTAGLPMQIALTSLLKEAQPDRLLIEPTGLGHPVEVLQTLLADHYQGVLSIEKILTLVDARKLMDTRYTQHEIFNQQIAIADIIVGNKQDLYTPGDEDRLLSYAKKKGFAKTKVLLTKQAKLDPDWLAGATATCAKTQQHKHHHTKHENTLSDTPLPTSGFIKAVNRGEGFESIGWRFAASKIFNRAKLFTFLNHLNVERMKAVFITEHGMFSYNLTTDGLTELEINHCAESRIEIITKKVNKAWEEQLMQCFN